MKSRSDMSLGALPGLSIVELMIALTLLALIRIAGLQVMQLSQTSFSEGRTALGNQQKNQAIAAFINQDFKSGTLANSSEAVPYANDNMPADLQAGHRLKLATLFGTGSRFDQLVPKCVLVAPADLIRNQLAFRADCHTVYGQTIATLINGVLRTGAKISFAIDGAGAKCSASTPIESTGPGQTAFLRVEDPACLSLSSAPGTPAPVGSHVLLPRFVAFDAARLPLTARAGRVFTGFRTQPLFHTTMQRRSAISPV